MQAVIATLLGAGGGFWLMFGAGPRAGGIERTAAVVLLVAGSGWYLYVRVRMWMQRRR